MAHSSKQGLPPAPVAGLLPTYALYGEPGRTQATDWLHCERIAERSQRHDWEIRPHRHAALVQILHIARGTAQAWLDGRSLPLAGPCVLLLPALVPHGFVFAPDIDGTVVTVLEQHLARLLAGTPALAAQLGQVQCCQWPDGAPAAAALLAAVDQLRAEFAASASWRELALDAPCCSWWCSWGACCPARRRAMRRWRAPVPARWPMCSACARWSRRASASSPALAALAAAAGHHADAAQPGVPPGAGPLGAGRAARAAAAGGAARPGVHLAVASSRSAHGPGLWRRRLLHALLPAADRADAVGLEGALGLTRAITGRKTRVVGSGMAAKAKFA
jgi:hypothetical protein